MVQGGRWGAVLKPGRGHVPPAAPPMVDLLVEEYVSSTKRVIRHVLPTPASPTTSSLNVVEYWPPGVELRAGLDQGRVSDSSGVEALDLHCIEDLQYNS